MILTRFAGIAALAVSSVQLSAQSVPALTLDKKVLTLAAARTIVNAAEAEATRRGLGVVIVVVDDSGTVIELTRMDAAQVASVPVLIGGRVVGAVGVSGDSPQVDEEIAIAGAKAISSAK